MVIRDRTQPVKLGSGIFVRFENRMYYHRRKALARYYEQRLIILAELGNRCALCDEATGLQVCKKHDALLPFRVCELFQMARSRLSYHLEECILLCTKHANIHKFGRREVTHGKWHAAYALKCDCEKCRIYRINYAKERREKRAINRSSITSSATDTMESIYLPTNKTDFRNGTHDDFNSDS